MTLPEPSQMEFKGEWRNILLIGKSSTNPFPPNAFRKKSMIKMILQF